MGGLAPGLLSTVLAVSVLPASVTAPNAAPFNLPKSAEISASVENVHYRRRPYYRGYYRNRCYRCGPYYGGRRYYRPYYNPYWGGYYGLYYPYRYRYRPYYPPYWNNGGLSLYFSF